MVKLARTGISTSNGHISESVTLRGKLKKINHNYFSILGLHKWFRNFPHCIFCYFWPIFINFWAFFGCAFFVTIWPKYAPGTVFFYMYFTTRPRPALTAVVYMCTIFDFWSTNIACGQISGMTSPICDVDLVLGSFTGNRLVFFCLFSHYLKEPISPPSPS